MEFEQSNYTVLESDGYLEICVVLSDGSLAVPINVTVRGSPTSGKVKLHDATRDCLSPELRKRYCDGNFHKGLVFFF